MKIINPESLISVGLMSVTLAGFLFNTSIGFLVLGLVLVVAGKGWMDIQAKTEGTE